MSSCWLSVSDFLCWPWVTPTLASGSDVPRAFFARTPFRVKTLRRKSTMIFDYSLAGLVSLGLLFYLTYALLRPERF